MEKNEEEKYKDTFQVVRDLPTQEYDLIVDDKSKVNTRLITFEQAIAEILEKVRNIEKVVV